MKQITINQSIKAKDIVKPVKERLDQVDLLKAIAIFFVVAYHFTAAPYDFIEEEKSAAYLNYFLISILSTCVPVFFFVNGALLLNKTDLNLKKHVYKIAKIIALIILWGGITMIALSLIRNEDLSLKSIVKGVWNLRQGWVNHLWYLEALIVIYVFLPLIFNAYKNSLKSFYFFLVCVLVFTFGNTLLYNLATIASIYIHRPLDTYLNSVFLSDFNAFRGIYGYSIGYFMLGGLLFCHRDTFKTPKFRVLAAVAIPVSMLLLFLYGLQVSLIKNEIWDIVWYGYDTIFTLVNVVAIYILSIGYKHAGLTGKLIKTTGENSLGIYFLHIIIGYGLKSFYSGTAFSPTVLSDAIYIFIILICSLAGVLVLKKLPIVRQLFLV